MSDDKNNTVPVLPVPGAITFTNNGKWVISSCSPIWNTPSPSFIFGTDLCGGGDDRTVILPIIIKQQKVTRGNCEGYNCITCNDFYPMAELNSPKDAVEFTTFACYECRNNLK